MKGTTLAAAVIVLGLAATFGGPPALTLLPTETYWTEADQAEYSKAANELHSATYGGEHDHSQPHAHNAPTNAAGISRLEAARAAYQQQEARLNAARSSRTWLVLGCRLVGMLIAISGLALFIRAKRQAPA